VGADPSDAPGSGSAPLSKNAKKNQARKQKREADPTAADPTAAGGGSGSGGGGAGGNGVSANGTTAAASAGGDVSSSGGVEDATAAAFAAEVTKRAKAVKKRLRQIDELRAATGAAQLNEDQQAKVAKQPELLAELAFLEALCPVEPATASPQPLPDPAKRLKALRKKHRQIEELGAKAKQGAELNEEQRLKLASAPQLARDVDQLSAIMAALGIAAE
jgi:hypothetical protein